MNSIAEENIEAGARVIFKRALFEVGLKELARDMHTETLVALARDWKAPVGKMCKRWWMFADGKPGLTENQRKMMVEQARRATELWTAEG